MKEKAESLIKEVESKLQTVKELKEANELKVYYLGKKAQLMN